MSHKRPMRRRVAIPRAPSYRFSILSTRQLLVYRLVTHMFSEIIEVTLLRQLSKKQTSAERCWSSKFSLRGITHTSSWKAPSRNFGRSL